MISCSYNLFHFIFYYCDCKRLNDLFPSLTSSKQGNNNGNIDNNNNDHSVFMVFSFHYKVE